MLHLSGSGEREKRSHIITEVCVCVCVCVCGGGVCVPPPGHRGDRPVGPVPPGGPGRAPLQPAVLGGAAAGPHTDPQPGAHRGRLQLGRGPHPLVGALLVEPPTTGYKHRTSALCIYVCMCIYIYLYVYMLFPPLCNKMHLLINSWLEHTH